MSVDSRERFGATALAYERYRPGYPEALVDWLVALAGLAPGARVVDLGAGTGISSRLFAARGFEVVGVEPNDAMRLRAEALGGARYVRGEAAATGLPDACAELAIAAQAFHWFDVPKALRELARVLVPGGWAAAFWNERAHTPFLDAYEALLVAHCADYAAVPPTSATIAAIRANPTTRDAHEAEFPSGQRLDREAFIGRVYSASYVVRDVADRAAFDRDLFSLFDRFAEDGIVDFTYRCVALAWVIERPQPEPEPEEPGTALGDGVAKLTFGA